LLGNATLEQLRGEIQADPIVFEQFQKKALRKGENDLKEDILQLKKEQEEREIRHKKRDPQLAELLKAVNRRKEAETREVFEESKLVTEIEKAGKSKAGAAKKIELERLLEEKKGLRLKEQDLYAEFEKTQKEMIEQEAKLNLEKEKLKTDIKGGKNYLIKDNLRIREKEMDENFTKSVDSLMRRKTKLEKDKSQIQKDLEAVLSGDLTNLKKGEISRWTQGAEQMELDFETKKKLMEDRMKINKMRENIRKTKNDYLTDEDLKIPENDAPFIPNLNTQIPNLESRYQKPKEKSDGVKSIIKAGGMQQLPGFGSPSITRKKAPKEEKKVKFAEPEEPEEENEEEEEKPKPRPKKKNLSAQIEKPYNNPNLYMPQQPLPPAYSQYYPYPAPPPWAYNIPPPQQTVPTQAAPNVSPYLQEHLKEMKSELEKAVKQSEMLESEIERIKSEPEKPMENSIKTPTPNYGQKDQNEPVLSQNMNRNDDLEAEEKAMLNLVAQERDSLKVLSKLDPSSEIYTYKLQQYKDMSAYRAEMEKALQAQRMAKLKFDFAMQKKSLYAKPITPTAPIPPKTGIAPQPIPDEVPKTSPVIYDKKKGFVLYIDFVTGLQGNIMKPKLAYNIYNNVNCVFPDLQTTNVSENEYGTAYLRHAHPILGIEPVPNENLICELEAYTPESQDLMGICWTFLPIFDRNCYLLYFFSFVIDLKKTRKI